jgi:hypothetical protein
MLARQYSGAKFDSKKNLVVCQQYCHCIIGGELEELCACILFSLISRCLPWRNMMIAIPAAAIPLIIPLLR